MLSWRSLLRTSFAVLLMASMGCGYINYEQSATLAAQNEPTAQSSAETPRPPPAGTQGCLDGQERNADGLCSCVEGFADCNGELADGCETSLDSLEHCGRCANACVTDARNTSGASCLEGSCTLACTGTFDDCDGDPSNGCERDIYSANVSDSSGALANCGACGRACAPSDLYCFEGSCFD